MIQRSLGQICSMINQAELRSTSLSAVPVNGVSTDTRTLQKGNLFIPLTGEQYDGHAYMNQAIEQGAAAILWQRDHDASVIPQEFPVILVDHTLEALQELASAYRKQLSVQVVGITGSNGKTSTKDMVAAVLATKYKVLKTEGNLNNHIGLPLTLLHMDEDTDIAVVEMGMSGRGEIELLSTIASPNIAIITNIGEAHMLQLGSREQITQAKFEILTGLHESGVLIYLGDEPLLRELAEKIADLQIRLITFGTALSNNDYASSDIHVQSDHTQFSVIARESQHALTELTIPLLGRHNAINALAAVATAQCLGLEPAMIRIGLQQTIPTGMRIELLRTNQGITILNDAYNASPASMKAAIRLLDELQGYEHKIVVVGDMLDLGPQSESFHREIGQLLCTHHFDYIFTYGETAAYIAEECRGTYSPDRIVSSMDKAALAKLVAAAAQPEDIILVKASRGMRMEELVEALTNG